MPYDPNGTKGYNTTATTTTAAAATAISSSLLYNMYRQYGTLGPVEEFS
jgi:hypothetical protein